MPEALVPIADNVWLYPADANGNRVEPNVGVIATGRGTVLVDAGNSPRHARRIAHALNAAQLPPVSHILYTHHHWDHVFGAQVFSAPAVAHELSRELLLERAARPWSYTFIEEEIRRNPATEAMYMAMHRAIDDWHGFYVVVPSLTFTHGLTLHVDGMRFDLEHVGGQHAPDSVVVRVGGVAFVGDCYYKPVQMNRTVESTSDRALAARLLADESIRYYVDGHTPTPQPRAEFARFTEA